MSICFSLHHSLAFIVGDIPREISKPYFGKAWILFITAIFYGSNALCWVSIFVLSLVSYACGKMTTGRLGRRGTCLVAYICQMVAFFILIFYHYHSPLLVWDWVAVLCTVLLLALGDSVWESQVHF